MKKFYITTPIFYPSSNAHLGHCYTSIAADVIARYKRLQGYNVKFLTGTDEHGLKIESCAKKNNVSPIEFVDEIVANFKKLWKSINISYDCFIRTTDDYHVRAVQKIFRQLYDKGLIYKGKYTGWYCQPCEAFFTDSQLKDKKCPDCGRDVSWSEEEAYFFKLSKFQDKILSLLKNSDFLQPESRRNEMIKFVENGLQDICVSRSTFSWGIPVDFDPKHVVYVWIDALTNYINALGYVDNSDDFKTFWPADLHIVGKEIVRFHAIIWPAILMALDLPLPKKIFGHGWILFGNNNEKMSKSKGNIVDPFTLCDRYGADSLRYFLLREISFGNDGLYSNESFITRINSDLANDLGNLVSRSTALVDKKFGGTLLGQIETSSEDDHLIALATSLREKVENHLDNLEFSQALAEIWNVISECNKYMNICAPWDKEKYGDNQVRLSTILYNVLEVLRIVSTLISPFMPESAKKIQDQIGAAPNICSWDISSEWGGFHFDVSVNRGHAIFPRVDF